MPKRTDIHRILVIGSGPIVIGQAAEFDYAGTQACLALREEGYEVILVNSNPATIMTDVDIADKVYMEPLTLEYVAKILRYERPDAILPGLGGQTGLNLAMQLQRKGVLDECQVEILGTSFESIEMAEDREKFKELCERLGEPVLPSLIATSMEEGFRAAEQIGYPVVLRPAFSLGGTGGGFADNPEEMEELLKNALKLSPVHQVLVEKSIKGYKEIEYEVMRDANDTAIAICNMENIDPVGVHTGDSIVLCPSQTLTNKEYHMLRDSALKIIRALKIEGGCNVQFALDPYSFQYYLIEVNPRVSRSSALASKASGYPIARVSAKVAVGMHLEEIALANTPACFEPALDYVVSKMARFPFDKLEGASNRLSTQMKATGEVMSVGRTIEESLLKAVRSLEIGVCHIYMPRFDNKPVDELLDYIQDGTDDRLFAIAQLIRCGVDLGLIYDRTKIDMLFLEKIKNIVEFEAVLKSHPRDEATLFAAKKLGFSDRYIGQVWDMTEKEVFLLRKAHGFMPVYKMIDTCASEFESYVPYFYSTYEKENESVVSDRKKIIVLGSGPIRIGQGVEFDYSTVHAIWTIRRAGYEAIIINNNPETVSTDFDVADKLYFEPLTAEDVEAVVELEKPWGAVVQFGGQTAIKLAQALTDMGVPILGTPADGVDAAEDRERFDEILNECRIPRAAGRTVFTAEEAVAAANEVGYPVLVRPSYVLGGQGMEIAYNDKNITDFMRIINQNVQEHPILVDKYLMGREVEVDGVFDGEDVLIPGIMEHVERAGVHSGDSISVYPSLHIEDKHKETMLRYTRDLSKALGVIGLVNIQFVIYNDTVYVIEVNPRSSRTIPYISKVTGVPVIDLATKVMLGSRLRDLGYGTGIYREADYYAVKMPVFSFEKLTDVDTGLGPEMKSTGECLGLAESFPQALLKAFKGAGMKAPKRGGRVIITVKDEDKAEITGIARGMADMGIEILATAGTADALEAAGVQCRRVARVSEAHPNIIDMIGSGTVDLVINTPTRGRKQNSDGFKIRRCAVEHSVACITAIDTARAILTVREQGRSDQLRPIDITAI